jgi:hypothetical protein
MEIVFLPTLLTTIADILLCVLCCYTIRILIVRKPSVLLLVSSILSLVISIELILYKLRKAFQISLIPTEHWAVLVTLNRYIDLAARLLGLVGIGWLLLVVVRLRKNGPAISGMH